MVRAWRQRGTAFLRLAALQLVQQGRRDWLAREPSRHGLDLGVVGVALVRTRE
jgi:hypothetical protein